MHRLCRNLRVLGYLNNRYRLNTTIFTHKILTNNLNFAFSSFKQHPQNQKKEAKPAMSIPEYLQLQHVQFSQNNEHVKLRQCPFCPKPHNEDRTNLYVLNIKKDNGLYHCFRCGAKGNWSQFVQKVFNPQIESVNCTFSSSIKGQKRQHYIPPQKMSQAQFFIYLRNMQLPQYKPVYDYILSRGFNKQTITAYNLGAGYEQFYNKEGNLQNILSVYFPSFKQLSRKEQKDNSNQEQSKKHSNLIYLNNWTDIVKVKTRGASKQTKQYMRQLPMNSEKGLFGFNLIKDTDTEVVITQGQFDAMAVYQQAKMPAISLPQGATNLNDDLLPYLTRFKKIILWMDNDTAGQINTTKIAQKLGLERTLIVKHDFNHLKDANDFLKHNPHLIKQLINDAKGVPEHNLINFRSFRSAIYDRITNQKAYRGIQVNWFSFFNKVVKGIRMSELTIMSGPTGSGKTSFLSQLSLDLCKQGHTVLWGSFQVRNQILLTSMLYQFSEVKLDKHINQFQYHADKFSQLPLYFMNFHGSTDIEKVLSTIIYAIQTHSAHLVVIDTLQFMLSGQGEGFQKFEIQDKLMARLRQISLKYNIHIAIVIHPRKTEDSEDIGIHSIYGTSKATQQADNVWIIQNREGFKIFDIKKNRYDGELGRIPLGFNRHIKTFFQLKKQQFEDLRNKQRSMQNIINDREQKKRNDESKKHNNQKTMINDEVIQLEEDILDSDLSRKQTNQIRGVYKRYNSTT